MVPIPHTRAVTPPRRSCNRFFVGVAIAMLVAIGLGFGKSFYLRPVMNDAPLPVYLVVHGLVMTGWYLLFLTQATLVSSRRMAVHRRLGVAGVVLAAAVVVTGAMVHLRLIPRMHALGGIASPEDFAFATGFVLQGLASLLPFVVLVTWAALGRRRPELHKRLMFWAMVWAIGPAFTPTRPLGQFLDPLVAPALPFFPADLLWFGALLLYDWRTLRRPHPATWLPFAALSGWLLWVMPWIANQPLAQAWLRAYVGAPGISFQ